MFELWNFRSGEFRLNFLWNGTEKLLRKNVTNFNSLDFDIFFFYFSDSFFFNFRKLKILRIDISKEIFILNHRKRLLKYIQNKIRKFSPRIKFRFLEKYFEIFTSRVLPSFRLIQISRVSNCIAVTRARIWKRVLWTLVNDSPDLLFNCLTEGRFTL